VVAPVGDVELVMLMPESLSKRLLPASWKYIFIFIACGNPAPLMVAVQVSECAERIFSATWA